MQWDEEDLDWDDVDLSPEEDDGDDSRDPDSPFYSLFWDDD